MHRSSGIGANLPLTPRDCAPSEAAGTRNAPERGAGAAPSGPERSDIVRAMSESRPTAAPDEPDGGIGGGTARVGRFLGPVLALAALLLTHPQAAALGGLSADASWTLAVLALMATWWVTLAIDPAVTGLVPVVAFALLGIGSASQVTSPYANDVIFLFGGGALLAYSLERSGVSARFAAALIRVAGASPLRVLSAVMVASALLSACVSNLATSATMLPLALALGGGAVARARDDAERAAATRFLTSLLLGVAFGASIGGVLTIIGTPPNMIAVNWLRDNGIATSFLGWMAFSVPTAAVFLPLAVILLGVVLFPARGLVIERSDEARGPLSRDEIVSLAVFAFAVLAWMTMPLYERFVPGIREGTVGVIAALSLFFLPSGARRGERMLEPADFGRVPWRVLILFGGGLCLAATMERTGLSAKIGEVIAAAGALPSIAVLAVLVVVMIVASEIASNTAISAMAVPVVGALAPGLGLPPEFLVIPAVFAASWSFAMPVGTPPNALVYASGHVRAQDMMRAGALLDVVSFAVIVAMAWLLLG
jgi:sodium-dependent dicarboxylate transporter 2/3/5